MRTKEKLRNDFRARRDAMPAELRAEKNIRIYSRLSAMETFHEAKTVLSYISTGSEVDTHAIVKYLIERRRSLFVPAAHTDRRLAWYPLDSWDALKLGRMGILEPDGDTLGPVEAPPEALVLVPAVAVTEKGHRLGYGRGYFDQFLSSHKGISLALAYEEQIAPDFQTESHDVPVDAIVTDRRVVWTGKDVSTP